MNTRTSLRGFRAVLAVIFCMLMAGILLPGGVTTKAAVKVAFASSVKSSVKSAAKKVEADTSKIYVARVENYLNCYSKKSTSGTLKGRLYRGCGCYVVKNSGSWSYISSGSLKGWVKSKYLVCGDAAKSLVKTMVPRIATVTATDLNVRTGTSTTYPIVANLPKGTTVVVLQATEKWLKVRVNNVVTGYMYRSYSDVQAGLYKGVTRTMEKKMNELLVKDEPENNDLITAPGPAPVPPTPPVEKDDHWVSLGEFKLTAYCPGACCNGSYAGSTATGATPTPGVTIAVDKNVIPLGSKIKIGDHVYIAQDTGVSGKTIDILVAEHEDCRPFGVQYKEVYIYRD